jgi:hypothetical protein
MNEKLDEFSKEMHELALQEEFSTVKFEGYIDKVRNFVSQVPSTNLFFTKHLIAPQTLTIVSRFFVSGEAFDLNYFINIL